MCRDGDHMITHVEVCVFITAGPVIKLCAGGEGDSEGQAMSMCVLILMSIGNCVKCRV